MNTLGKLALLSTLYLSQGLPFGFFTQALPVLLREQKVSLTAIGFTSLLAVPWALKFLWAPIVDRAAWQRLGRRRSWILPLQACAVLMMVAVSGLEPTTQLQLVLAAVLMTNLLAATQDIASDGLAVSLLTHAERGLGNGVQVAGYRVGMIVGGGALLIAYERIGWTATFLSMAALLAVATVPIALWREPHAPPPERRPKLDTIASHLLGREGMRAWLLLLMAYKIGESLGGGMVRPMLVDLGLDLEDIGWLLGAAGFTASLVGALLGGWLTGVLGRRTALLAFGALQATGIAVWLLPALGQTDVTTLYGVTIYDHLVGSMATAALFTAMMDACDPETGGTDYTLQASAVVLATGIGSGLSGASADGFATLAAWLVPGGSPAAFGHAAAFRSFGYAAHFMFATALTLLGAAAVARGYALPGKARA